MFHSAIINSLFYFSAGRWFSVFMSQRLLWSILFTSGRSVFFPFVVVVHRSFSFLIRLLVIYKRYDRWRSFARRSSFVRLGWESVCWHIGCEVSFTFLILCVDDVRHQCFVVVLLSFVSHGEESNNSRIIPSADLQQWAAEGGIRSGFEEELSRNLRQRFLESFDTESHYVKTFVSRSSQETFD